MLDYRSTANAMHIRTVDVSWQEYVFVMQVVMGEEPCVAYASAFDNAEFKRHVPSDDEEEYLSKFKHAAEVQLGQHNCVQLRQYLEEEYNSDIQDAASKLEDYNFTGRDIKKLLANLLKNRTESLDDASVKDTLSLIKSMFDNGYLDSDEAWNNHFITIPKKYDAICSNCNHELYAVEGIDIVCSKCGQVYKWSDNRFYPQMYKL